MHQGQFCRDKAFARYDAAGLIQAGIASGLQRLVRIHHEDVTSGDLDTASSVFADDCENAAPYRGSVKLRPVAGIRQVRLPPHLLG